LYQPAGAGLATPEFGAPERVARELVRH